ncbi:MAG TPA: PAS domain S-box protein [Steroidobacteraceae bacterium]|nr:PAS domain S-box protein [Steroidobacteraceae bacterium]
MDSPSPTIKYTVLASVIVAATTFLWLRLKRHYRSHKLLASAERRNAAIVEASREGVLEIDAQGAIQYANPMAIKLLGYDMEEIRGRDYRELIGAPQNDERDITRLGYTTDMLRGVGAMLRCKGRHRPIEYRMVPVRNDADSLTLLTFRDMTDRSRIDVMLADMQHLAKVGAWELNVESSRLTLSESFSWRLKLPVSKSVLPSQLLGALTMASQRELLRAAHAAIAEGHGFDLELQLRGAPNAWVHCIGKAERINGQTVRLYGALQDVTERHLAERTLCETRDFFSATLDSMPSLVVYVNRQGRMMYRNQSPLCDLLGLQATGTGQAITSLLNPVRFADLHRSIQTALSGTPDHFVRVLSSSGPYREAQFSFVPERAADNGVTGCFMVMTDVTELKMLEARLRQAEKMQAIGQLTGGVAHDFNNLLGVILGNLQLLERDVSADPGMQKKLQTAMQAAIRGADLTRRLLTFARRQVLEPTSIDLNKQLTMFFELVKTTAGEGIEIKLDLDADLWPVSADAGQLENAILNLIVNSRDAMPNGGSLMLSARNVKPDPMFFRTHPDLVAGDYVMITVRDTGSGIPPQLLSRVFEPFFTTKDAGKGSGLGLSIVHGFTQQSGGTVTVNSETNKGTAVSIYLPRDREVISPEQNIVPESKLVPGGHETILVVEDDTDLRATTTLALESLGYNVVEASNSAAALQLLKTPARIDVLFTDVFMPGGMMGSELATRARECKPQIQVLYTTGYGMEELRNDAGNHLMPPEDLLLKPYRSEELAHKIRSKLDSAAAA